MRLLISSILVASLSACAGGGAVPKQRSATESGAMAQDFVEWFDQGCLRNAANLSKDGSVIASAIGGDVKNAYDQMSGGAQETEFAGDWALRKTEAVGTTFINRRRGVELFAKAGNGTDAVAACGIVATAMKTDDVHNAIMARAQDAGAPYAKRADASAFGGADNFYELPLNGESFWLEISELTSGNGIGATLYRRPN